jgi:hypothetical protein
MDFVQGVDFESVAGVVLIVIGVWAALQVAKTLMKLAMIAVALIGMYLFVSG